MYIRSPVTADCQSPVTADCQSPVTMTRGAQRRRRLREGESSFASRTSGEAGDTRSTPPSSVGGAMSKAPLSDGSTFGVCALASAVAGKVGAAGAVAPALLASFASVFTDTSPSSAAAFDRPLLLPALSPALSPALPPLLPPLLPPQLPPH